MVIYAVFSNYFNNNTFGFYSNVKYARIAFEDFLASDEDIVSFENVDGYFYRFTTKSGEIFGAEICYDILDEEFVEGICKED